MTTLLNISGISSGSEVNVTTEILKACIKPMFEGKVENGWHLHIYTQRTGKASPFQKEKQQEGGTKYFYTLSLFGICEFTFVVTDTQTQISPVGELRSELGIVLAKIQLKSKQNGYIPNEKTVNTNGIE